MNTLLRAAVMTAIVLGGARPATANDMDAVGAAIQQGTGNHYTAWAMTKLTTFKVGAACWKKLATKGSGVVDTGMFVTRSIAALAKAWTGEDWAQIESQSSDRAGNAKLVEPMIEAFKQRFSITVQVDGDDCDPKRNALWIRYWSAAVSAVSKFPPPAGKAFITIHVSSRARDLTSTVSKDGTTFSFEGPRDIEAKIYGEKLERPFRQLASGLTDDLAFLTKEATGTYYPAWVLTKLHTWKLGKQCYPRLADKDTGVHAATYATRSIASYAKGVGAEDWDRIEGQSTGDKETNRRLVEADIDGFRKRFSITIAVDGADCELKRNSMVLKAWTTVTAALDRYPPKAKKVAITLTLSAKAKAVAIKVGKQGATFAITVPRDTEPTGWSDQIQKAFKQVSATK